jgi:hypothetical protein
VLGLATTGVALGSPPPLAADPAAAVIASYRERIPELMAQQGIPGLDETHHDPHDSRGR